MPPVLPLQRRLVRGLALMRPHAFRLARSSCPVCGYTVAVKLRNEDIGVRCLRCGSSAIAQSLIAVIRSLPIDPAATDVYELSAFGPVVDWLRAHARSLATSEFFEDVPHGEMRDGIRCENVEALTFADASFDLCTSTEVFEHVEDDRAGFGELLRVLRPGGHLVLTVPLTDASATVERTAIVEGRRVRTLPPEYHADRFRGPRVFCYRNYGRDIVERLADAGFESPRLVRPQLALFGFARRVVVARRPA